MSIRNIRVAVLIDLSFFLERYRSLRCERDTPLIASVVAEEIESTAHAHIDPAQDLLQRIFIYDCRPLGKKAHHPVTGRSIDFSKTISVSDLPEGAVAYDVEQKGVDVRMAIDIASLAYKKLADRIVLITGDSDFVPAAKLARREGLDVILDPLWAPIVPSLVEHVDGLRTHWPRERVATSSSA